MTRRRIGLVLLTVAVSMGLLAMLPVGANFYAIKRTNITNAASVNLAFGFTSKKLRVATVSGQKDDIVIDWLGRTAVCPAANTAGDDRIATSTALFIDDIATDSISVRSCGPDSETIYVTAFN
jgi:hypothetical protein